MTVHRILRAVSVAWLAVAGGVFAAAGFDPLAQPVGTLSPLAISNFNLSSKNENVYQAWFESLNWSGDVSAYLVDNAGRITPTPRWSARQSLDNQVKWNWLTAGGASAHAGRTIIANINGTSDFFDWGLLKNKQQKWLAAAPINIDQDLLNFIRGDNSKELPFVVSDGESPAKDTTLSGSLTGKFRARASAMGDVTHSKIIYVGSPSASYFYDDYLTFLKTHPREGRVYFGANDGMLHSVRAPIQGAGAGGGGNLAGGGGAGAATGGGDEVFAYIPSMLIPKLQTLAANPYALNYFVDGGMAVADANFTPGTNGWRTVLVGGLGAGGRGLYALDVTDETPLTTQKQVKDKILWELTEVNLPELGNVYGDPLITRIKDGRWVALVGNGYNNGYNGTAGNGHAVLYVLDVSSGKVIAALDTGSGSKISPNGLSSPTAVDMDSDGFPDTVYAGDIDGNVWKFDIKNIAPATWVAPTTPFFAPNPADAQPILGAPDVAAHPFKGVIVYFTTGSMFTAVEAANSTVQNYAYGLWDGAPPKAALLNQTLTDAVYGTKKVRLSSGNAISWLGVAANGGWRTALPAGERVLGNGFVREGRYHFVSVNPTTKDTTDPNGPEGASWLMELDYLNGAANGRVIFDLNTDGNIDNRDRIGSPAANGSFANDTIPVGVYVGKGLVSQPLLANLSFQSSVTLYAINPFVSPGAVVPPTETDRGVTGGHFDVEIWYPGGGTCIYQLNNPVCPQYIHTHEYDDKFDVTGIDMTNASDPRYNLKKVIPPNTKFQILMGGQEFSPAVSFKIGKKAYVPVFNYETDGTLTVDQNAPTGTTKAAIYDGSISALKWNMPKNAFTPMDWALTGGPNRVGLQPTTWSCVQNDKPNPLTNNPLLSGALYIQLVKPWDGTSAGTLDTDIEPNVPGNPKMGYRLKSTSLSKLLASYSIFYHAGACYLDANWSNGSATPVLPYSGTANTMPAVPAPGSQDPPYDTGAQMPTNISWVRVSVPGGGYKIIITTTYADGSKVIETITYNAQGKEISRTTSTTGNPPGTPPRTGGSSTPGSVTKLPPATGYTESRDRGKTGRVNWHEMFRD